MNSLDLQVSSPDTVLSLLEELCDVSFTEMQLKLNAYIQVKTGAKICFLAPIISKTEETVIHVIGNRILNHEFRLPVSEYNKFINVRQLVNILMFRNSNALIM